MAVPSIRLYEDIVCHHFYNGLKGEDHIGFEEEIEEGLCKRDEVQEQLNILFAGLQLLGALPCEWCGRRAERGNGTGLIGDSFNYRCSLWAFGR